MGRKATFIVDPASSRVRAGVRIGQRSVETVVMEALVENRASCVMHRFRTTGTVTICGWNTGKARINGGAIATYSDGELAHRPWWKMCDKCLTTEREVARLAAMDDEHSLSD